MTDEPAPLTAAELVAGVLLGGPVALALTAYLLDAAGWPIDARAVAVLVLGELAVVGGLGWRAGWRPRQGLDLGGLVGFAIVLVGFFGFAMWLGAPSLLPRTHSGDTVNHLTLIDFIRQHRSLPHDSRLEHYLGQMATYPPGSHILGALVAGWLGLSGVQVMHGVLAFFVALKAGLVYVTIRRLGPPEAAQPGFAMAGAAMLLLSFEHVIGPLLRWGFYAQVVGEAFALGALWALVYFDQRRATSAAALFVLYSLGVLLTWTALVLIPLAALIGLLVLGRESTLRTKLKWPAVGLGALVVIGVLDTFSRRDNAAYVTGEGAVLTPTAEVFSWPLLALGALGLGLSLRRRATLPLLLFLAALLGQAAAFWLIQARAQMISFYLTYKLLYLLPYPLAIFGGVGLAWLASLPARAWPSAPRQAWAGLALALPLVVLGMVAVRKPRLDWPSAIRPPFYEAGLWARDNLPNGCVDYLFSGGRAHWVTGYWLQVSVFGNPVASERTMQQAAKFYQRAKARDRWADPERLPYAIVGDWPDLPRAAKAQSSLLYLSTDGESAVVERRGPTNQVCRDETVPLDRLVLEPRRGTIVGTVAALSAAR